MPIWDVLSFNTSTMKAGRMEKTIKEAVAHKKFNMEMPHSARLFSGLIFVKSIGLYHHIKAILYSVSRLDSERILRRTFYFTARRLTITLGLFDGAVSELRCILPTFDKWFKAKIQLIRC